MGDGELPPALWYFRLEETRRHNHHPRAGQSYPLMRLKLEVLVGTRAICQICFVLFSQKEGQQWHHLGLPTWR